MNQIQKFGIFSSAVDPNKLGKTVEGIIIGASVFIVFLFHKFGIEIVNDQVTDAAVAIGSIVSTFVVLFGLIRKVVVMFTTPKKGEPVTPPVVQVAPEDSLPPLHE